MSEEEAKKFVIDVAYVAFPAARKFVLMNSSDPVATVAAQSRALVGIDRKAAQTVIDRWLTGSGSALEPSDFEHFPLTIRRQVLRNMPANAPGVAQDERKPIVRQIGPKIDSSRFLADLKRCGEFLKTGVLSHEEVARRRDEVLRALEDEYARGTT